MNAGMSGPLTPWSGAVLLVRSDAPCRAKVANVGYKPVPGWTQHLLVQCPGHCTRAAPGCRSDSVLCF
jgi:hypothetical protein